MLLNTLCRLGSFTVWLELGRLGDLSASLAWVVITGCLLQSSLIAALQAVLGQILKNWYLNRIPNTC